MVDYLIHSGGHANYKNQKGTTALMRAAQEGHSDVVNLLVRSSGEVNEANVRRSKLFSAVMFGTDAAF